MEHELERKQVVVEEGRRQWEEELKRDKEKESGESEQGETRKTSDFGREKMSFLH